MIWAYFSNLKKKNSLKIKISLSFKILLLNKADFEELKQIESIMK